jgi:hypothetical protein
VDDIIVGQDKTDALLAECWLSTKPDKNHDRRFIAELLKRTPDRSRSDVNDLLQQRGVA